MALSNTETFAFTQIPAEVNKSWTRCSVDATTLSACNTTSTHRASALNRIELKMRFDNLHDVYKTSCSTTDDSNDDAIALWRENRQLWSNLETAVSETIERFVKEIRVDVSHKKNHSLDVPLRATTTIVPFMYQQNTNIEPIHRKHRTVPESVLSIETGITPNDSASSVNFNMSELQKMIKREVNAKKHLRQNNKQSKSMSLLNYAAGRRY